MHLQGRASGSQGTWFSAKIQFAKLMGSAELVENLVEGQDQIVNR